MNYFYDGQFKSVISQFQRIFSGFKYMTGINHTGRKELLSVPCMSGNVNRMVGMISKKNSENVALTAPFFSCWIENIDIDRSRTRNQVYEEVIQVTEQNFDFTKNAYTGTPGDKYTIEMLSPVPYNISMNVDLWTTNEEMKLQLVEQVLLLFNPSIDIQKNTNGLDPTNRMIVELKSLNYSSRSVPVANDSDFEITNFKFDIQHFELNPPAKVKKQVLINTIIQQIGFDKETENGIIEWTDSDFFPQITTVDNLKIVVEENTVKLFSPTNAEVSWTELLNRLDSPFEPGVVSLRLKSYYAPPNDVNDIIVELTAISNSTPNLASFNLNTNSLPATSLAAIDAVINPWSIYPDNPNPSHALDQTIGRRYLITKKIIPGTEAWGALEASPGSIIQTDDGVNWFVSYDSDNPNNDLYDIVYNNSNGDYLYRATTTTWLDVYQGTYMPGYWRIVNITSKNKGI